MPSESDTFSNFTKVSRFVSSLDLSVGLSEYKTYTYDGQPAEKVCPTYPPIYRYGATQPPPICSERKYVTSKPEPEPETRV